ncbi:NTF2 and RRM domain-containing protein [Coccidioides immitis H538.4]|uniref:NTF2 and RRM domain-containing protein n=1 Tax=Coccidioides immitis H538.4 TaxID=396776 RepID=A0A0J8RQY2_COCIT|nr:NTF2 and RRM domain-containing protein [Coccidioides immitis H538.4]
MATEAPSHVNGAYTHHQPAPYHADRYPAANAPHTHQPSNASTPAPPPQEAKNDIPKEEVAWFFVEQYYTTLSRTPEKLHLFYSRKSQFVSGNEAEKVGVSVGQTAIQDRIKSLDFHDTKVRVLNVDSQASFDNILVSVIGELSNRSEPPRKFVQTFVLAEQRNGYYVLNDIIRFLVDDDEEAIADEQDAVRPRPQRLLLSQPNNRLLLNGLRLSAKLIPKLRHRKLMRSFRTGEAKEPEPTPIVSPPNAATPAAEKENVPPARPVSMTWASIASSNANKAAAAAVATPVAVPQAAPAAQPKVAAAPPQPAPPANGESAPSQTSSTSSSEWQTAGRGRDDNVLAYIKNVNDKVDAALLKQTLQRFGKLKYFDVSRQRSCAFVEFADAAGYKAAVAANPHQIGTERITVEERRPRATAYGGNASYGPGRGGAGRGRGDRTASQGRGGFQKDSGRFTPRGGRGGTITPKGRPQSQAA